MSKDLQRNTKTFDDNYFDHLKSSDYEKLSVEEQLKRKTEVLETLFNKKDLLPFIKNPKPKGYRHKAVLSAVNIKLEKNYQIRLGLYVEGSKTIKPRLSHMLHHPSIDEMFKTIEKLLIKYKFKAYYAPTRDGIIKHVMIRKSYAFDQYMVVFATNGNLLPNHKLFVQDLIAIHPNIVTVIQNIHHKDTNLVLLEDEKILYGNGYIEDMIDGLTFRISSRSFYQVNPYQMMNLYHKALELADINEQSVVLDCYSGIGTLTLLAAKRAKKAYGFEINDASHQNAITNKKINNIENAFFYQGDVEELIVNFKEKVDVLLMDPTRDGASLSFIQSVQALLPKRIIYISCEPKTQSRDIKQLSRKYTIETIQPVDMFTYTQHVETIALLSLKRA